MQKDDVVSLWLGWSASPDELEEYVQETYPDDTNKPISDFAEDIGVQYYDEDFREFVHLDDEPKSIIALLEGFSYENIIRPRFAKLLGSQLPANTNTAILLYNFEYPQLKNEIVRPNIRLRFGGCVSYKP